MHNWAIEEGNHPIRIIKLVLTIKSMQRELANESVVFLIERSDDCMPRRVYFYFAGKAYFYWALLHCFYQE